MQSDDAILDMIFNPGMEVPPSAAVEPAASAIQPNQDTLYADIPAAQLTQIRELEARAIIAAEAESKKPLSSSSSSSTTSTTTTTTTQAHDYSLPLQLFDQIISMAPTYASAYNNRAQIYQLMGDTQRALTDTNRAIELASSSSHHDNNTVLKQAYTQRALIRKVQGADVEEYIVDFQRAAALGSVFARKEAVRSNPYAQLCNQYLQQAMDKHWSGLGHDDAATVDAAANDDTHTTCASSTTCGSSSSCPASSSSSSSSSSLSSSSSSSATSSAAQRDAV